MLTVAVCTYFYKSLTGDDKSIFLPGQTSDGHHQIELACPACHGESFTDAETMQKACERCHAAALEVAKDDHPKSKFTDPRNADRTAILDARYCVTCHVEHKPERTLAMGLTLPDDYCHLCHEDIAEDRPSHAGMPFETCASAGCHNFHDNRALYEDFLAKHLDEPAMAAKTLIEMKPNFAEVAALIGTYPLDQHPLRELPAAALDAPPDAQFDRQIAVDWAETAHAKGGVNCKACHVAGADKRWTDHPDHASCKLCHQNEMQGFLAGKHGMRLDSERLQTELAAMRPALARLPMKEKAEKRQLNCTSCHQAHRFDTRTAAIDACLECHDDEHSLAFVDSPHHQLWRKEQRGELPEGSGVTCATCHMPRIEKDYFWGEVIQVLVEHNQSDTLRPNEKMIRPVCLSCHGLGFSIDALADPKLISNNFKGRPSRRIESIDLAEKRLREPAQKSGTQPPN